MQLTNQLTPSIAFLADVGELSPADLAALGRKAEVSGFRSAWMVEYEYDSLALNQALLAATAKLVVGSCIARATAHSPLQLAMNAAVVDLLAPGRYIIGIGSGPRRRLAERPDRVDSGRDRSVARMREYLEVVRIALDQQDFAYDGEFFNYERTQLRLRPTGYVPIYLAAGGSQMARLAGRIADGAFIYLLDDEGVRRTRDAMTSAALEADRDPERLVLGSLVPTCIDDDEERALLALRAYLFDYYFHLPHYHNVVAKAGFVNEADSLRAAGERGDTKRSVDEILADPISRSGADAIPRALLEARTVFGTPDQCRKKLDRIAASGIDLPILYPFPARGDWMAGYVAAIDAFATNPLARASVDLTRK